MQFYWRNCKMGSEKDGYNSQLFKSTNKFITNTSNPKICVDFRSFLIFFIYLSKHLKCFINIDILQKRAKSQFRNLSN